MNAETTEELWDAASDIGVCCGPVTINVRVDEFESLLDISCPDEDTARRVFAAVLAAANEQR